MAEIVGEASGENAWKMVMETGGYDKDRAPRSSPAGSTRCEFYLDRVQAYQLPGADRSRRSPGGETWDGVTGELWEVSPIRQKLASYPRHGRDAGDRAAAPARRPGELIRVGTGRAEEFAGKDVAGKIVVTEGSASSVHQLACIEKGALGVVSIQGTRPYFDPLQIGWASVRGTADKPAKFAFQIPPREGDYLKRRLLSGAKITASAKVESAMRKYTHPERRVAHPRHRPERGRSDPLRAPVRRLRQAGRQRRHLRQRDARRGRPRAEHADRRRPAAEAEAHDPLHHRARVLGHRPVGDGEQGADGEDALQHQPRHGRAEAEREPVVHVPDADHLRQPALHQRRDGELLPVRRRGQPRADPEPQHGVPGAGADRRADRGGRAVLLQHRDALRRLRPRGVQRLGRAGAGHHDDRLARPLVSHVRRPRGQDRSDRAQARGGDCGSRRLHRRQRRRRHGGEDRERDGGQRRAAHRPPAGARVRRDGRRHGRDAGRRLPGGARAHRGRRHQREEHAGDRERAGGGQGARGRARGRAADGDGSDRRRAAARG